MSIAWSQFEQRAIEFRHYLHQRPELTWQEVGTAESIRRALDELSIPWRACAKLGTIARLAADAPGKHIALRCDMDALPVDEACDLPYRSERAGCMHACGHDGHTAVLWGTAAWLKSVESQLPGPVTLVFQPAEEGGHGARALINDGALEGIDLIFGWHNWPAIPFGKAVCPDGAVMSGNGTFEITVHGTGGHASQPELCRDPILAAAAITLNLQQIVSRRLPPQQAAVVAITSVNSGTGPTITPESAVLTGSIRIGQPQLRAQLNQLIQQICDDTARSYGVSATVAIEDRYEATVNHSAAAQQFRDVLVQELGAAWQDENLLVPVMASEDFSYYLNEIPGAFALIGNSHGDKFQASCHSPHYQFNDALVAPVMRIYSRLAGIAPPG